MKLGLHRFDLELEHLFTIARGSLSTQQSLVVELEHNGISGFGEATANPYYGFTIESMTKSIESCRQEIEAYNFGAPEDLWSQLQHILCEDSFAQCAIDLACHDLFGKLNNQPTYQSLNLQWQNIPDSSYTIGIDAIDTMVSKLNERPGWSTYKIKLGTEHDVEIVSELRKHTDARFRVDANCGWTAEETVSNSAKLKALGVEFIEQPLPADASNNEKLKVFNESVLPIIADENCLVEADVAACHGVFHGINVKLCKCGGLTPGVRMLQQARALGMKTMVGCMIESSVGISAAAQLLPLLDYADLDGAVLLSSDIATGVQLDHGRIHLPEMFGNGVTLLAP